MKRFMTMLGMVILFGLTAESAAYSIPPEPGRDKLIVIRMIPQQRALLFFYDTDGDNEYDYVTQREIYSDWTVNLRPSHYAIDLNRDGEIDVGTEVWIDIELDGVNGNEILYSEWLELQNREV